MAKLEPREYSRRLGVLTHLQLQSALDRFDLGELQAAEPAQGGLFGQNVLLDTSRGRFVLRGCPHTHWQLAQERHFAQLIHERSRVPAPWPYHVVDADDIFGWGYALMPRLPGDTPEALWADLDRDDRHGVAAAMGDALGELQAIEAAGCGEWDPALGGVRLTELPFAEWALDRVCQVLATCREAAGVLSAEDAAWVEREIDQNRAAFDVATTPTFLHTDYARGNVVVMCESDWRVTGVFDLQQTCFGDPEEDLSRAASAFALGELECARVFIAAYGRRRPFRPGYAQRFRLHMLRDRLGIWHYGRTNRVWFKQDATFQGFARWSVELDVF